MLYTKNQIEKLIRNYENLLEAVEAFVRDKHPKERRGDVRISGGWVEEYVNTACHCHPEMSWETRGTIEEFSEWIKDRPGYKTTYYQKL